MCHTLNGHHNSLETYGIEVQIRIPDHSVIGRLDIGLF
jgi:hypothetical protein